MARPSPSGARQVGIDAPISSLRGAGPVTAARLAAHGVGTARELLLRLPRGYDDLRRVTPLAELSARADGEVVLVRGTVRRVHVFPRRLLDLYVQDGEGDGSTVVRARWFRAPGAMAKSFPKGSTVALAGPLRTAKDGSRELLHPTVMTDALAASDGGGLGWRPRYAAIEGVPGRVLERLYASALAAASAGADELLPAAARARLGLPTLAEALARVHAPAPTDEPGRDGEVARARRRVALEEMLVAQVVFLLRRAALGGAAVQVDRSVAPAVRARLDAAFGFALTGAQARAIDDVAADLAGARPMRRLLVGDVGSGKTAVALAAAALVAAAGGVTLMMVPTEVLAEQQARALAPIAARLGFGVGMLTGSTPAAARAALLSDAAAGKLRLLVGTQALLGEDVELPGLGLVIVDEQHRFGVADRARLGERSTRAPHLLAMSATPIPRSLALALHGDLDASFLDQRPAGRHAPVAVPCLEAGEREAAYARLREEVAAGRQAFVVCAVREEARRPSAVTAVAHHARLARQLAPSRVGLLHGALRPGAKEAVLRAFAGGALDVLVATTVVELGIDVPNATVMIVEEADRFGLAQLHQLRGRVGRGGTAGVCFLCATEAAPSPEGRARLELVGRTEDGFRLAEADLAQRGFGDLLGTRQAGASVDTIEDLASLVSVARAEAEALLSGDPALERPEHLLLARTVAARSTNLFGAEAG